MHKDNAVGNVVAETGRDLVFMTSARLSDLSVPLKGEVRRSPEQSAWQPIARSGKFVRRASSRGALGCEETTVLLYAFCLCGARFCLRRGWGKRGDLTWHPAMKHQRPAAKTTNSNCCDRAVAQVKQHPNNPGERTVLKKLLSTEQISKKGIKLILKTIGNRKEIVREVVRGDKHNLHEKICKLQSTNQDNVWSEWHWFVHCDLQIFSCRLCLSPRTTSRTISFLFPIVFSINISLTGLTRVSSARLRSTR